MWDTYSKNLKFAHAQSQNQLKLHINLKSGVGWHSQDDTLQGVPWYFLKNYYNE